MTPKYSISSIDGHVVVTMVDPDDETFDNLARRLWQMRVVSSKDRRKALPTVHVGFGDLTERERQVLGLIAEGFTSREVGRELAISHRTVEVHRKRIMEKLKVHNVFDLARVVMGEPASSTEPAPSPPQAPPD